LNLNDFVNLIIEAENGKVKRKNRRKQHAAKKAQPPDIREIRPKLNAPERNRL